MIVPYCMNEIVCDAANGRVGLVIGSEESPHDKLHQLVRMKLKDGSIHLAYPERVRKATLKEIEVFTT